MKEYFENAIEVEIKRNEYLLKSGSVENSIYYVHSGALRVYYTTDEDEVCVRFGYKGSILSSLHSFFSGEPSEFSIQAIRKTKISKISKDKFYHQLEKSKYIKLLEIAICTQIEREIDLLTISPTERYRRVLERSPKVFQEIPHKYIASYLRMTPETLSRIRNS